MRIISQDGCYDIPYRYLSENVKARRVKGDARISERLHYRQRLQLEEIPDCQTGGENRK